MIKALGKNSFMFEFCSELARDLPIYRLTRANDFNEHKLLELINSIED